jgi:hypothetical protein
VARPPGWQRAEPPYMAVRTRPPKQVPEPYWRDRQFGWSLAVARQIG